MNRLVLVPAALALLVAGAAVPARAQYPAPGGAPYSPLYSPAQYSRPPVPFPSGGGPRLSPYLDLLRGGNPAANYYLGVRPERERRRFEAQTGADLLGIQQGLRNPPPAVAPEDEFAPNPSVTGGYVAVFNNTGSYFNSALPGATGARPPAPRRTPLPPPPKK